MIFLIDTTTNPIMIGLWDGKKLKTKIIESNPENNRKLISIIQSFLKAQSRGSTSGISPRSNLGAITAVGVINGPGTFTGVRTGIVIANTLAYALKIPLYAIDTLTANVGTRHAAPLRELNNIASLLSASNNEVYFARFKKGKMQGKIEIVNDINLKNRLNAGDIIMGDLMGKHCGLWEPNEFKPVTSKERTESLLQMILNNKIKPVKQVLPLYIKKPNITRPRSIS